MSDETITLLGDEMMIDMFNELADMISPTLKGYKCGCAPADFVCPICLDSLTKPAVTVECGHMYHLDCIENWTSILNNCPTCRQVLPGCSKTLVEELLIKTKNAIKESIMTNWFDQLRNMSDDEVREASRSMNMFTKDQGW